MPAAVQSELVPVVYGATHRAILNIKPLSTVATSTTAQLRVPDSIVCYAQQQYQASYGTLLQVQAAGFRI